MSNQHRVAIVTGAGSGIGREVCHGLLRNGWRVELAGRRRNETSAQAMRSFSAGLR